MPTILLINPNTSATTTRMMVEAARPFLPPAWDLRGCEATRGVPMITDETGLPVAAEEVVRIGRQEACSVDAIIVAAFADPGAETLRACLSIPVIGIGEAALREAGAGGRRFGVATTTPGLVASMQAAVRRFTLSAQFTGVRVPRGDPLVLAASPADQDAALADAVQACLHQDHAAAVVIGGGPLSASAARLTERFGTAIVQPVQAAVRALTG